jgi:hypothetical protein
MAVLHPRIKVFVRTKDDTNIIEDWIKYHANLFGYDNVCVIDNMSREKDVIAIYDRYKNKISIRYTDKTHRYQGDIMTSAFNAYKTQCDIMIALDADEFLAGFKDGKIIQDKSFIRSELVRFNDSKYESATVVGCNNVYHNTKENTYDYVRPAVDNGFFHPTSFASGLVKEGQTSLCKSEYFERVVAGNHSMITKHNEWTTLENLVVLHFDTMGFKSKVKNAYRNCLSYGYIIREQNVPQILERLIRLCNTHPKVCGQHKCRYMVDYYARCLALEIFKRRTHKTPALKLFRELIQAVDEIGVKTVRELVQRINNEIKDDQLDFSELSLENIIFGSYDMPEIPSNAIPCALQIT